jgi:hypothetical protein
MGRRSALFVVGALVFALGACGGDSGGGDEDAFCDSLDALSELVADGDLGDNGGLEDATEAASDLLEVANEDQADAVTEVGETLEGADPDDAADTADLIQDELGDFADDCDIDEFAEAPEEETTTTTEPEEETTTTADPDDTTTTEGGGEPTGDRNIVTARLDPAEAGVEPGFEGPVDLCFQGLMSACDDLFFGENGQTAAPDGSVARDYAASCGGRILQFNNDTQRCAENLFAGATFDVAVFTDASFEPLATACLGNSANGVDGDMQACDDLFLQTGVGTPEEAYGRACGGRLGEAADREPGVTSCVDIFGPTAAFG